MESLRPASKVRQCVHLLSGSGGILTILSAVFYGIFAKKYEPTEDEMLSEKLSLRWLDSHHQRDGPMETSDDGTAED